ncbi:MAG: hypothetical protein PHD74_03555 [Candidatus Krumholzibacteria bacterium]|nr:hypothetical protein [Candidatus Krumholzibacteria bacterium]
MRKPLRDTVRRASLAVACAALAALAFCGASRAETPRRISVSINPACYIFDSRFFDVDDAFGGDVALRYEIARYIHFESAIGSFRGRGGGVDVDGFDYRLNLVGVIPVLVPYRPIARLGVGFISVDPITVTPTETFRPTQTAFYFLFGAGITRSMGDRVLVELGANLWLTPYRYRIYRFDRQDVEATPERFEHLAISVGAAYTF